MRIGVDGYNMAMANGTGVASYGVELVGMLRALGHTTHGVFGVEAPVDPALRESVFFDKFRRPIDEKRKTNRYQRSWRFLQSFRSPRPRDVKLTGEVEKSTFAETFPLFDRLTSAPRLFDDALTFFAITGRFTQLRVKDPPDVMHWTYPVPVFMTGVPNIYTLHDLVPLKLPYTTLDNKELYGRVVAGCVNHAARICTVSESSRRDILERFGIDQSTVVNTYQTALSAASSLSSAEEDARSIEGIFGLGRRNYFLYFGAIEPKKNVGRLIEAYLSLQSNTPLVIVGARAWQSEQELKLLPGGAGGAPGTYHGHRGQTVIRLDYLSRELLEKLVRGAKAVVFPSLYEGFGLPVLEAMQVGTPVIASNTSSLPEIVGDAGLLVDPYDVNALRQAMARIDSDDGLAARLSALGKEQSRLFSREHYGERLASLYAGAMTST